MEKSKGGSGGLSARVVFRMVYLSDSGWGHKDFEVSHPIVVTITIRNKSSCIVYCLRTKIKHHLLRFKFLG